MRLPFHNTTAKCHERENLPLPRSVGHSLLENIFAQDQVILAAKCETAQKITCKMNNDVPLCTTYM